jgi:hypothetical protein
MDQPQLSWDNAKANDEGSVFVPFVTRPTDAWADAIWGVVSIHNSETRGNAWGDVELSVDGSGFIVQDVEPGERQALEGYLDNVLNIASQHHQRDQARAQQQAQTDDAQAREREERTKKLRDEYGG